MTVSGRQARHARHDLIEPELADLLAERRSGRAQTTTEFSESAIAERLQRFLQDEHEIRGRIEDVTRLAGGGSNALYAFTLCRAEKRERLVLRLRLAGSGMLNPVAREFQMMRAGGSIMSVPRPCWQTEDASYFGAPALITEFSRGVQSVERLTLASGMGTTYRADQRETLGRQFVDFAADLHAADPAGYDLGAFNRPRPGTTDAIDWRLAFWDEVWTQDRVEEHPTMCLTREWLWEHRPIADKVSLLHGDFRNGNFLFDPETGRITAVLDWELAWLGDRHADLAYMMFRSFGQLVDDQFLVAGLVPREEFLARYQQRAGLEIDPNRLRYYAIYNMYWTNVWILGTGLYGARHGRGQLGVMCQVMTGQAIASLTALNALVGEARR
jgi:aminoglycoside phosphotransferase (APT) family kinase protein